MVSAATAAQTVAQPAASAAPDSPVAVVGSKSITFGQLREVVVEQRKRAIAEKRIDVFTPDAVDQTLDGLVDVKLFSLDARARELDRRPEVARRLEAIVDEALAQIAIEDLIRDMPLDDEALQSYFAAHRDAFRGQPRVHARQIIVRTQADAEAAAAAIGAGADFAAVARERNIDATKERGGDLGWLSRGTLLPVFETALFALAPGETSGVFQTSFGFHLVHADEIDGGGVPSFDAVKDRVRRKVIDDRLADARHALRAKYPVTIRRALVDTLK
jgi:peptidyl-prolyl cis-trans isomerase C